MQILPMFLNINHSVYKLRVYDFVKKFTLYSKPVHKPKFKKFSLTFKCVAKIVKWVNFFQFNCCKAQNKKFSNFFHFCIQFDHCRGRVLVTPENK